MSSYPRLGPPGSSSYTWHVPRTNACVHLKLNMVGRLEQELAESEMSGILLGSCARVGEKLVLTIEDYELSKAGLDHCENSLRDLLSMWRENSKRRMYAVGLLRKYPDGSLELTEADRNFLGRSFQSTYGVALLLSDLSGESKKGALLQWEGQLSKVEVRSLRFPFSHHELMWGARDKGVPSLVRSEPAVAAIASGHTEQAHAEPARAPLSTIREIVPARSGVEPFPNRIALERKKKSKGWIAISMLLLIGMGLAGFVVRGNIRDAWERASASFAGTQQASSLGLRAVETSSDLTISWNRSLPFLTAASAGTLTITDGAEERVVTLDGAFLREGKVTSPAPSGDVNIRLEIDGQAGRRLAESLRVLKKTIGMP